MDVRNLDFWGVGEGRWLWVPPLTRRAKKQLKPFYSEYYLMDYFMPIFEGVAAHFAPRGGSDWLIFLGSAAKKKIETGLAI